MGSAARRLRGHTVELVTAVTRFVAAWFSGSAAMVSDGVRFLVDAGDRG